MAVGTSRGNVSGQKSIRSVILQTRGGRIKRPIVKLFLIVQCNEVIEDNIPVWLSEEPKEKRTVPK